MKFKKQETQATSNNNNISNNPLSSPPKIARSPTRTNLKINQGVTFSTEKSAQKESSQKTSHNVSKQQQQQQEIPKYQPKDWPNKIITEVEFDQQEKKVQVCKLLVAFTKGTVQIFDLKDYLNELDIQIKENALNRLNYNPYRQIKEDFFSIGPKIENEAFLIKNNLGEAEELETKEYRRQEFRAHKDALTTFQYIDIGEKNLITASHDKFLRIWSENGRCIANVNCNHPLPISWNLESQKHIKIKKKIYYALKILDLTKEKYKHDMVFRKIINVSEFISKIARQAKRDTLDLQLQEIQDNKQDITVMADEFSPRDLRFKEVKYIYEKEIRGPSLKQMDATKRLLQAQMQWKQPKKEQKLSIQDVLPKKRFTIEQDQRDQLNFLHPNYYEKVLKRPMQVELKGKIIRLNKQLDQTISEDTRNNKVKIQVEKEIISPSKKRINRSHKNFKKFDSKSQVQVKIPKKEQDVFSQEILGKLNNLDFHQKSFTRQAELDDKKFDKIKIQKESMDQSRSSGYTVVNKYINFFDYASQKNLMESGLYDSQNFSMSMVNQDVSQLTSNNVQYVEKMKMHQIMKNLDRKLQLSRHWILPNQSQTLNSTLANQQNMYNSVNVSNVIPDSIKQQYTQESMDNINNRTSQMNQNNKSSFDINILDGQSMRDINQNNMSSILKNNNNSEQVSQNKLRSENPSIHMTSKKSIYSLNIQQKSNNQPEFYDSMQSSASAYNKDKKLPEIRYKQLSHRQFQPTQRTYQSSNVQPTYEDYINQTDIIDDAIMSSHRKNLPKINN